MEKYSHTVTWSDSDGCWIATVPEFEGVSAFGDSPAEALQEVDIALELAIETYQEEGWSLPEPARLPGFSGQLRLRLPKTLHAWLAREAERNGVSLNTLMVTLLARAQGEVEVELQSTRQLRLLHEHLMDVAAALREDLGQFREEVSAETYNTVQDPLLQNLYGS